VGSIFRSAETAGASLVLTCGITCHPPHPKLMKTALSSADSVPTRHFESTLEALEWLKTQGYTVVVMETTDRSETYTETTYPPMTALVVGNEVSGVDTRLIEMADKVVQIPTYGVKNSLNVASALPIVLFEVLRQWKIKTDSPDKSSGSVVS
jgi:tRNA G18 (ribose-2'-O)-methylase SpoU